MKIRKAEKKGHSKNSCTVGAGITDTCRDPSGYFYTGYYEIHPLRADRAITTGESPYLCCRRRGRSVHGLRILPTQGAALFHEYGALQITVYR